jgi:hypothetical protein
MSTEPILAEPILVKAELMLDLDGTVGEKDDGSGE